MLYWNHSGTMTELHQSSWRASLGPARHCGHSWRPAAVCHLWTGNMRRWKTWWGLRPAIHMLWKAAGLTPTTEGRQRGTASWPMSVRRASLSGVSAASWKCLSTPTDWRWAKGQWHQQMKPQSVQQQPLNDLGDCCQILYRPVVGHLVCSRLGFFSRGSTWAGNRHCTNNRLAMRVMTGAKTSTEECSRVAGSMSVVTAIRHLPHGHLTHAVRPHFYTGCTMTLVSPAAVSLSSDASWHIKSRLPGCGVCHWPVSYTHLTLPTTPYV